MGLTPLDADVLTPSSLPPEFYALDSRSKILRDPAKLTDLKAHDCGVIVAEGALESEGGEDGC